MEIVWRVLTAASILYHPRFHVLQCVSFMSSTHASQFPTSPDACPSCGRGANQPCRHGRKGHSRVMCSARRPAPGFRHDGQPMFSEAERLALRNAKFTAEQSA